jgi:hypothetical protein
MKPFKRISNSEMKEIDSDPMIPFGRGLIDGMQYADENKRKLNNMFWDSVFGDADNIPEKWTSKKRGKRLVKNIRKFKKMKII